jgi:hypothetical protein
MKRMLHSSALLLLFVLCTGILQAQLEEDFTPNPANWILANGFHFAKIGDNDVIESSGGGGQSGENNSVIGTPIVNKSANTNTVDACFDVWAYQGNTQTPFPCATYIDLVFVKSTVNNANDIKNDPTNVYGTVSNILLPTAGGRICANFAFPASVPATDFRMFITIHADCASGGIKYVFDNFSISGLTEVCNVGNCAPVALNDTINVPLAGLAATISLTGSSPSPAIFFDASGTDNDPNDALNTLTWSVTTQPTGATVTLPNPNSGTAVIIRNSLSDLTFTFKYNLCDPGGLCDTGTTVVVNFAPQAPLPISLLSFNGNRNGSNVTLKWTTASESNNAGFEIQRIVNGDYKTIAFVSSKGENGSSAMQLQYQFSEVNNTNAVSWYRLVQINTDGTKKILPSLAIRGLEDLKKLLIYPNPGSTVNVLFGNSSVRDVLITDLSGKQIKGWNDYSDDNLTIHGLPTGMYLLRVIDKNTMVKTVSKILINR